MSRRSETDISFQDAQEEFAGQLMTPEAALGLMGTVNEVAMIEMARSLAEAADELKEIRQLLEKLNRREA